MPAEPPVKELPSPGTEGRKDVLEIWCRARRAAECRRIEHAANAREQGKACKSARDLEATGADVLMWDPVAHEVEDRPDQEREEPRSRSRAGSGAGRHVQRDDHAAPAIGPSMPARPPNHPIQTTRRQSRSEKTNWSS